MPFPNPDTQWKPGQSGNPGGHSSGRRIAAALHRLLDEQGLDKQIALTFIAKALGDLRALGERKPDWTWFEALLEAIDGPAAAAADAPRLDDVDGPKRIVIPDADDRHATRED